MQHDQRICPRCGEPAGDYRFCQSCSTQMDSLTSIPTPGAANLADPSYLAAQVLRLEQALADASKGISDRIAGEASTAVQVEPESRPRPDSLLQSPRQVARLEEVLTVGPAEKLVPPPVQKLVPPPVEKPETRLPEQSVPPPSPAELPAEPAYVAAQLLREAFWFEQASAFKPSRCEQQAPTEAPQPVVPEAAPAPCPQPEAAVVALAVEPPGRSRWMTALCVLALIALVALLTGRKPRRLSA